MLSWVDRAKCHCNTSRVLFTPIAHPCPTKVNHLISNFEVKFQNSRTTFVKKKYKMYHSSLVWEKGPTRALWIRLYFTKEKISRKNQITVHNDTQHNDTGVQGVKNWVVPKMDAKNQRSPTIRNLKFVKKSYRRERVKNLEIKKNYQKLQCCYVIRTSYEK